MLKSCVNNLVHNCDTIIFGRKKLESINVYLANPAPVESKLPGISNYWIRICSLTFELFGPCLEKITFSYKSFSDLFILATIDPCTFVRIFTKNKIIEITYYSDEILQGINSSWIKSKRDLEIDQNCQTFRKSSKSSSLRKIV
jgi:hypothetical protein